MKEFADNYLKEKGYKGCDDFFSSANIPQEVVFDMMNAYVLSVLPLRCINETKKNLK
jgi:hypothetical protein